MHAPDISAEARRETAPGRFDPMVEVGAHAVNAEAGSGEYAYDVRGSYRCAQNAEG